MLLLQAKRGPIVCPHTLRHDQGSGRAAKQPPRVAGLAPGQGAGGGHPVWKQAGRGEATPKGEARLGGVCGGGESQGFGREEANRPGRAVSDLLRGTRGGQGDGAPELLVLWQPPPRPVHLRLGEASGVFGKDGDVPSVPRGLGGGKVEQDIRLRQEGRPHPADGQG